ncbi:MAG: heterodisulfide reductase subunit, partial [Clostridia bacterium]|nr:heterodisulfide reductase subunit [Clostridia bacterium]
TTLLASSDHAPRIGVFICDCEQLSSSLDLKLLEEYGRSLPDVAWVQKSPLCNFSAAEQLQRAVKEQGLSRIIAAACSARALEPVITGCLAKAGLPGSAARVVNILDHAARIYSHDREFATKKAQDLVRMAAARVREAVVRLSENIPVSPSALVVGGGVAGMVCALTLGDLGYEVYLVEKEANLGGNARRLQRTLTGAEVQAWLSELTQRVIEHPRIHIYFGAKVSATGGKLGSFKTELEFAEGGRREVIRHGVTVLATGAVEKRPKHYLYGAHPAVVTGLELEELLKSQSQRLSTVRRVVFIQCVGSRDADHPYCSRTCCSETLKNALELKKINPRVEIYVLNRDVMAYGLREQLYEAARSQGVLFLRYSPESPPEVTANRKKESGLQVKAFDPILGEEVTINADLLVLAAGMEPRPQNARLASLFRVPLDENGFFAASHPKLKTVETPVPGIFTCGLAEGPKSLEEAVASAQAAAVKAAAILAGGRHPLPGRVAQVEGACAACLTCVRVCPYGAPAIKDHRSHIDPLLCQGCGACVAACPAGAITLTGYSQAELDAELRALPGDPDEALRTVVFTCSYCAYTASENAAGTAARGDVSIVQVPCLSRVGTLEILRAIEAGAEQIVLTGCVEGQCHFRPARAFGNERSAPDPMICQEQAWRRTRKILHDLGLGEGTIRVLRVPPPPPGQRHPLASCF